MNRVVAVDRARAEVARCQAHCRESWHDGTLFHEACSQLRQAEEKLRLLGLQLEVANDTRPVDVFELNYPRAQKSGELLAALAEALPPVDFQRFKVESVYDWDPRGEVFFGVARWAQIENAHWAHANREPTPGMVLPERLPMPLALAQALTAPEKTKGKRARKKAAS
jgi:hypothetical protein